MSGPYIQLLGYDSAKALWRASVLIVTPPSKLTVLAPEPVLTFYDGGVCSPSRPQKAECIPRFEHACMHLATR